MARTLPSEADLGLEPTAEELAGTPVTVEDDVSITDDVQGEPEKPPVQAKEPDPAPAAPKDGEKPADEPKTVDLRALQEARAEARDVKARNALLETRLNAMLETFNRPQPAEQPAPQPPVNEIPPEDDLAGRINWLVSQMQRQGEVQAQTREEQAAQTQRSQFLGTLKGMEDQFRATTPDYDNALSFAGEARERELQILYPLSTAEQRRDYILREWDGIVQSSVQAQLNPAEQVYKFAVARGYTPAQAATAAQQVATPAPKPMDTAALAAAQQRHQSLSDAPGGGVPAPLDAKSLASMTDKQFKAWLGQKGNEAKLDEILGA